MTTVTMTLRPLYLDPLSGLNKVVTHIECRFAASDDAGAFNDSVFESVVMGVPNPSTFIPLKDCTAADFLTWVKAAKGADYAAWKVDCEARAQAALSAPVAGFGPAVAALEA